jgi:hypothetical protein
MICYKLTDQNAQTKNATQWGRNVTHTAPGTGELCSSGWLHAYTDPLLAVLLNPTHANIQNPRLWEARGGGRHKDDRGLKIGFENLTTIKELPLPDVTLTQRVAFGILCALEVETNTKWRAWATAWIDGTDRSRAAYTAYTAAARAAYTAIAAAAYAAAYAAAAAAYAHAEKPLDLIAIARKAMEVTP